MISQNLVISILNACRSLFNSTGSCTPTMFRVPTCSTQYASFSTRYKVIDPSQNSLGAWRCRHSRISTWGCPSENTHRPSECGMKMLIVDQWCLSRNGMSGFPPIKPTVHFLQCVRWGTLWVVSSKDREEFNMSINV
jgi:hypothetical protein